MGGKGAFMYFAFLVFVGVFVLSFFALKQSAILDYGDENEEILDIFSTWGIAVGIVFGALSLMIAEILKGILGLFIKSTKVVPVVCFLAYIPWFLFAVQLIYFENRYIALAKAIIFFIGKPLLVASVITLIFSLAGIFLVKSHKGESDKSSNEKEGVVGKKYKGEEDEA